MRTWTYRRYAVVIASSWAAVALLCCAGALLVEPLFGDLTRLGGYPEAAFGWNGDHPRFDPPIARPGSLDRRYDVVVVGDSFSMAPDLSPDSPPDARNHWTDHLAARTGLAVGVFNRSRTPLEAYLSSAMFRSSPPRLLVVEYAERTMQDVPVSDGAGCPSPGLAPRAFLPTVADLVRTVPHLRDRSRTVDTSRIDEAIDLARKDIPRRLLGRNATPVFTLPLSRLGLFSSVEESRLLVFKDDFVKARFSDAYLDAVGCYFLRVQRRVEANGVTKFVLMVAPDRTTAYSEYLPGVRLPNLSVRLAKVDRLSIVRVDVAVRDAVRRGIQDVYEPSDTHWAPAGMSIATDALIRFVNGSP